MLMHRFGQLLYRTARSIVKDDCDAEDVLQSTYLLAYREIRKFRGDAKLSTWLVRIVVNEALACLRRRKRHANIVNMDPEALTAVMESMSGIGHGRLESPEHALIRADLRHLIDAKVDALPASYRTVFILRAIDGLSVAETAARLDIPKATVRTRFFRAKTRIREALPPAALGD
jgi:RNA polymerase sigma-70 factor (ECF subfamily)